MLSAHLYPRGGVGGPSPDLQVDVPGPFPNPKVAEHEENHFKRCWAQKCDHKSQRLRPESRKWKNCSEGLGFETPRLQVS